MMNIFLFFLFLISGSAGIYYQADAAVFIGFGLMSWQLIRMKVKKFYSLTAIIISALVGAVYFISYSSWKLVLLFLLIIAYNLWGYFSVYLNNLDEDEEF